jgi:endonuclease III
METVTYQDLMDITQDHPDADKMATAIEQLVEGLNENFDGIVPQKKDDLVELADETVASEMMTQVFGSTDFSVGLHARKILIALDMFDWEDSADRKQDVKMSNIYTLHVKKSLKTWMPKGTGKDFHDMMESVGSIICARRQGEWGKIKAVINAHFPYTEKTCVLDMVESISQFYKATKSKKGKSPSP